MAGIPYGIVCSRSGPLKGGRTRRFTGLLIAITLVISPVGIAAASAGAAALTSSPTVSVTPKKGLIGNQVLKVAGKGWTSNGEVAITLCAGTPQPSPGPCLALATEQPSRFGTWSLTYEPLIGSAPAVCQSACYFDATRGSVAVNVDMVVLSPSRTIVARKGPCCYLGQPTSEKGADFPAGDPVHIEVCSTSNGCDPTTDSQATASTTGVVKFTGFILDLTICSTGGGSCYLLATDTSYSNGPITVVDSFPVYCGPIACPSLLTRR
jgi:hypothetical protein